MFTPFLHIVYHENGFADDVNFKLSPAIRGPEHTHSGFECVDEGDCDEETYVLCAKDVAQANVDFVQCMDAGFGSAADKAEECASSPTAWTAISRCFSDKGPALKQTAALYFDRRFPDPVGIPRVEINGQNQNDLSVSALIDALCATGITAPACSGSRLSNRSIIV